MSIQGARKEFRMTNEQSDYNYWHERMKGDEQFIQHMTEYYMKQQLEIQTFNPTSYKMNHRPLSSSSPSSPSTQKKTTRHLQSLMDCPFAPQPNQQNQQINSNQSVKTSADHPFTSIQNQTSSTPRRPLDESGSPGNQIRRQNKKSRQQETTPSIVPNFRTNSTKSPSRQFHFPSNHLKHAVSNNLPCFYIKFKFNRENAQPQLPSAMNVAGWIRKLIQQQTSLVIGDFSIFIPAGDNRYKFGVSSKNDFLKIWNCNWPEEMNKIKIDIERPRALPDCCALVLRYVPADLSNEFVVCEVNKTINSAVAFSKINYHRPRPTNDYRFCVTDAGEYEEILNIGRISIGHVLLPITEFIPGLKMTYCTCCWELGHTRTNCNTTARCRKCLDEWDYNHRCSKPTLCAQCKGPHSSLSMECLVVKNYRRLLKDEVNKAAKGGLIQQIGINGKAEIFQPTADAFPAFPALDKGNGIRSAWRSVQGPTNDAPNRQEKEQLSEIITRINDILDSTHRMEKKMDNQGFRMDLVENRTTINKHGLIELASIIQQTINTILEKKNKQQLTKLCQRIEDFKNDTIKKFNDAAPDQHPILNPLSSSQVNNRNALKPPTSIINESNNIQLEQDQSMEAVNDS